MELKRPGHMNLVDMHAWVNLGLKKGRSRFLKFSDAFNPDNFSFSPSYVYWPVQQDFDSYYGDWRSKQ